MEDVKRILRYQYKDGRESLVRFWGTILLVNVLFLISNKILGANYSVGIMINMGEYGIDLVSVVGGNLLALFILFIVFNYDNYYRGFPMAIGFSTTRKNFMFSLLTKTIFLVGVSAIVQGLLFKLDPLIVKMAGKETLHNLLIFDTKTDSILYIIFTLFMMFLSISSIWSLVASLNYKFGYIFWIVYLGFHFTIFSISPLRPMISNAWEYVGKLFITRIDIMQFLRLSVLIIVSQGITYLITSKTDVKYKAI